MKQGESRGQALLSLTAACVLALGSVFPAAAEEYPTFGQLISGETVGLASEEEVSYTVISVSTEEDLYQLAQDCALDAWSRDKYIRLENDIALEEYRGLMIPSFGGIFDGGGHKISGLEITEMGSAMGLFRYIQAGGEVHSLSVSGKVNPEGSRSKVGILAGVNYGRITDCSVLGSVTGAEEIGGIAGSNEASGEIRRCQSAASVTGDHYTGGICGVNKGILNNCTNSGEINTHSVEIAYSLDDITAESLEELDSIENVAVHMDTGGIAGYSEGKIYYCTNTGTVGYQHVGYNVGGIVGRLHQAYLQNCTNRGHVLGRKDVGGIAGQMEPFLEIAYLNDKLSEIDREADIFFNLLEAAQEDLSGYGRQVSDLTENISGHLNNAATAGGNLTGTANDLWYIYNQELTGINNDLNRLNQEWAAQAEADKEKVDGDKVENVAEVAEDMDETNGGGENAGAGIGGNEPGDGGETGEHDGESPEGESSTESSEGNTDAGNVNEGNSSEGNADAGSNEEESSNAGDSNDGNTDDGNANEGNSNEGNADAGSSDGGNSDIGNSGTGNTSIEKPEDWDTIFPDKPWDKEDWREPQVDFESYIAALRRFGESTNAHLSNITSSTNDRSGGISNNLEILDKELENACNQLRQLADVLEEGSDSTSANVDALMEQAKVLRRSVSELRDDLFRYEKITVEDASDEAAGGSQGTPGAEAEEAYYDTESFQKGKITLCLNEGDVEADTNVGGIVGQVSIEYDFDPEDDISFSGAESFNIEQTVKAVVRESRNMGNITAKKNCAGGIVGKADFGSVVSCESYGAVCSTGGSYVGGIAGSSDYCIRSCYVMGTMSGKSYVGGIVGSGSDVFYSYAYPDLEYSEEFAGSIAGKLKEDGTIFGNYYVLGNVPGVDRIGYEDGAMSLDYAELCEREGVPEAFSLFTVSFRVDGQEIAAFQCHYGDAIDQKLIPEIPQKEGYYGVWPEFDSDYITGNRILEAIYEKWIPSLASEEKDERGRTQVLVQGEFLPEARLRLEEGQDGGTRLSIPFIKEDGTASGEYDAEVLVRVLCDDVENAVAEIWTDSGWQQVPNQVLGSYVEFSMEAPGTFRVTYQETENKGAVIAACAGGLAVVLAGFLIGKMLKSRKRRKAENES